MGEAFGDPEKLEGVWLEVEAFPFSEGWGVGAKIDGDVPDVAGEDADEFALGFAELIVEAAENALGGEGLVVLNEVGGELVVGEGVLIENFREPAATISEALGFKQLKVLDGRVDKAHRFSLPRKGYGRGMAHKNAHFGS